MFDADILKLHVILLDTVPKGTYLHDNTFNHF